MNPGYGKLVLADVHTPYGALSGVVWLSDETEEGPVVSVKLAPDAPPLVRDSFIETARRLGEAGKMGTLYAWTGRPGEVPLVIPVNIRGWKEGTGVIVFPIVPRGFDAARFRHVIKTVRGDAS